jgi:hypothetical protein
MFRDHRICTVRCMPAAQRVVLSVRVTVENVRLTENGNECRPYIVLL